MRGRTASLDLFCHTTDTGVRMMHLGSQSLWHHSEFLKLWAGQTISRFGSGVTANALPLTAVLLLGASASDMGWLLAVESAPVLLVGLFAGVWVDRVRRRPLLIGADLGRAGLLACIPIVAALGGLRIEHLFVVAAATGVLTVLFDVAYRSFVPDLVGREGVLEANSRLATVEAVAEITTPGLTGALVQVIAAPLAILLDAVSLWAPPCVSWPFGSLSRRGNHQKTRATTSGATSARACARLVAARRCAPWRPGRR